MKIVRIENNSVREIIPSYALPVEKWYGPEFAAQCKEAPDDVEQNWMYDPETGEFSAPALDQPTPAQQREEAYNTQAIISFGGEMLTVTQASQKWQYYAAEGNTAKTDALTALIAEAKASIREQYPDEEAEQA